MASSIGDWDLTSPPPSRTILYRLFCKFVFFLPAGGGVVFWFYFQQRNFGNCQLLRLWFCFVVFFFCCFYLEFLVALRLAERRRKSIVGAAAVVVAAAGCDGQSCNRVTATTGYWIQFPLAGFAEDGQSPFAPRKYKSQKMRIDLSSSKRFSRVHNKIDDNNWDNRIRCLFISPQINLCKKRKRRPKSGVPEEQVLPPDTNKLRPYGKAKKVEECVLRVSKYRGTMCFFFPLVRSFVPSFGRDAIFPS